MYKHKNLRGAAFRHFSTAGRSGYFYRASWCMFPLQELLPQDSYLDQLQKSLGISSHGTRYNAIRDSYSSPVIHKPHKPEMGVWPCRHNPWEGQVRGTVSVKFLPRVFTANSQWKQAFSISKHMKVLVAVINHVWRSYLLLPGRACPPRVLLASGDLQKLPWGEVQRGTEFSKTLLLQSRKNVIKSCCCESGLKYYLNHTLYLKIYDFKYDFMIRNVRIYKI